MLYLTVIVVLTTSLLWLGRGYGHTLVRAHRHVSPRFSVRLNTLGEPITGKFIWVIFIYKSVSFVLTMPMCSSAGPGSPLAWSWICISHWRFGRVQALFYTNNVTIHNINCQLCRILLNVSWWLKVSAAEERGRGFIVNTNEEVRGLVEELILHFLEPTPK
jgi:hypothetical protein